MKLFKFKLISKIQITLLCSIVMALMGCEHNVYNPNEKEKEPNSFNFSTTSTILVNVKYEVPKGYQVLFDIYLEDPFTTDQNGQIVKRKDLEPAVRRMTDGNGVYSGKEVIDADHGKEAYIYSSYAGVPTLFKTTLENGTINADINWKTVASDGTQTRAITRGVPSDLLTLGKWNNNGYPDYIDKANNIKIPAEVLSIITNIIPENGNCPSQYRQSIDFEINDPKGRKAEVSVRMIGGTSGAANTFGYYCYNANASVQEIRNARKCVIFPNTLMYSVGNKRASGLSGGESIKLHYIDANGKDQGTEFPNGVKIGWFLINDKFYGNGYGNFYSTTALNNDGRTHTAAFRIDDFVVLSFEDYTDHDYNDIQFNVWSNPIEAIVSPELPNVKPDTGDGGNAGETSYSKAYKGIVAFEDNWPNKGDYDMNDVVVKYNCTLNFNKENKVLSTEDTYELLWSGASFKNGFAYQLNTERTNVTTEIKEASTTFSGQGLDADLSKATINVLLSAVDATGGNTKTATYKVKNTFKTPIPHETLGAAPYNPFIMVQNNLGSSRTEVHLVNHHPTDKANMNLFNTGNDLSDKSTSFYVAQSNYPFAINLSNAESFSTTEKQTIDKSYPNFIKWVESNGANNKDWYK